MIKIRQHQAEKKAAGMNKNEGGGGEGNPNKINNKKKERRNECQADGRDQSNWRSDEDGRTKI